MMIKLTVFLIFLVSGLSQLTQERRVESVDIEGNINDHIEVKFPFDQVLQVKIQNGSLPCYVQMVENRVKLNHVTATNMVRQLNKSLVEDFRSPWIQSGTRMFNIGRSLIIYHKPNRFLVVHQFRKIFKQVQQYKIQEIKDKEVNVEVIEDRYIMVVLSAEKIVLFNQTHRFDQDNPFPVRNDIVIKRMFQHSEDLFVALIGSTVYLFEVTDGIIDIKLKEEINHQGKNINVASYERGKRFKGSQQIWIIDEDLGLFLMVVTNNFTITSRPVLIQKLQGCHHLDIGIGNHKFDVLLTCRQSDTSTFKILSFDNDNKNYPFLVNKNQPYIERCLADKFRFFRNYIFSMEDNSMDLFVPAKRNGKLVFDKFWVSLEQLKSYVLVQTLETAKENKILIFGVNDGVVFKKELTFQNYSLILNSTKSVSSQLVLQVSYMCQKQSQKPEQVCQSDLLLQINIHNNIASYVKVKSINMGVVFILFTVLIAIFVLCRYKYRLIYERASRDFKELTNPDKYPI